MKVASILIIATIAYGKPIHNFADEEKCGYNSCHPVDQNKINVHLVPHSHDDVGWLKTVDQYYYTEVQQILSSVVEALLENPDRRFIQVETAFFYMWWNLQTDEIKSTVKNLVNEGRLEIVNGAWSMNDEAIVHYQSTIDQYTLGLRYVQDNLGTCARPRVSWQIDPFGHSREQASLLAQFGMDGLFFARFDYRDKAKRLDEKNMELFWKGSANLGTDSNIFTSALYNHYSPPPNFCFDILCMDEPIVNDTDSFEYNWKAKINEFAKFIEEQSKYYLTNNIIITMGDDFQYQAAPNAYLNIDKLILGFQKLNPKIDGKEVNMIYSTPSCYTKAVHDYIEANEVPLDVKIDDFLPYAHEPHRVWTGYFTSRPSSKRFERQSNNLLQVSKQLGALTGKSYESNLPLGIAMGVMQHHDAITGTEHEDVERDYHRQLAEGIHKATQEAATAFSSILGTSKELNLVSCTQLNVSVCSISNENEYNVLVYNPLARITSHYIIIPVQKASYEVEGPTGDIVESQITILVDNFTDVPDRLPATLIFKAEHLPALGYKSYKIRKLDTAVPNVNSGSIQEGFDESFVDIDLNTGYLKSITINNATLELNQQFLYYKSSGFSNAYIFRPDEDEREAIELELLQSEVLISDGDLVREVKQTFDRNISQIIRVYKDEDFIEFDWFIGSQDHSDGSGIEIVTRYTANLANHSDEFFTDSNGREMLMRKRNYRPSYNYTDEEPQSGNYYPVTTRIVIRNDTNEFAVMTDRSEGGTSLNPGEIELMVFRQVPDGLYDSEYDKPVAIRGSHYITHGISANENGHTMPAIERDIVQRKVLQPWLFFTTDEIPVKEQSFLNKVLPANVHLLTLESWSENTVLIRLEHIFEKDEDIDLSKGVTVDLTDLFKTFTISSMKEYMLAANIPLEESERLKWSQLEAENVSSHLSKTKRLERDETDLKITLEPMQIRTFLANVTPKWYIFNQ